MTHATYFQDIEYIYIKVIYAALRTNITKTNLSLLGGQLNKNSSQGKNKQEQKCNIYSGQWNNIKESCVQRHR